VNIKTELLLLVTALGFVAPFALPTSDAATAIASAMDWMENLHIAGFAAATNALTIMP
jgi:hypothetical protein